MSADTRQDDGASAQAILSALSPGSHSTPRDHTIDITTLGRHSGKPQRIELWFHFVDGRRYITGVPGPRAWMANLLAEPRFVMHLKNDVTADLLATATQVTDEAQRQRLLADIFTTYERTGTLPRSARLGDWVARSPLVEITLDEPIRHVPGPEEILWTKY